MIATVTVNPTIDLSIWSSRLRPGCINRHQRQQLDAGGKGINVSRLARRLGELTVAYAFIAGSVGRVIEDALVRETVPCCLVRVGGESRINVVINDAAGGEVTRLYGPGPEVGPDAIDELERAIAPVLRAGNVLVLGGSLPPGIPDDFYARLLGRAREAGALTILDTDGPALRLGIDARPDVIKPNVAEAERLLGRPLADLGAIAVAARELRPRVQRAVVISMGARGAMCAAEGLVHAIPPDVEALSRVGTGDSLVAGLAIALAGGRSVLDGLRLGTAAAVASAMAPGTASGTAETIVTIQPHVRLEPIP